MGWINIDGVVTRKNKDIDYLGYYDKRDHINFYDDLANELPNRY